MCRFLVNCFEFFDSAHRFVLLWSQIRPNWTEKSSNNPVGDLNYLKNDCVKTVFFNSVFEIFVLKVCVLKHFQKMTVYVENVDFRKTHQAWLGVIFQGIADQKSCFFYEVRHVAIHPHICAS